MPRPLNIALVEDNPDDVLLMQELLKDSQIQYFLHVLKDGEQASDFIKNLVAGRTSVPDLMFLDLNLPKVSGHEILAEVRNHKMLDNMRIVVLTTSDDPEDRRLALVNRADCYCLKPPALENLWNVLDIVENACLNIALSRPESQVKEVANILSSQAGGAAGEAQSILLIEDNPNDILYMRKVLEKVSPGTFKVQVAENLSDALENLRDTSYDLILTDLGLPDAQGLQILTSIGKAAAEIPIIILTGLDDEKMALHAVSQGAQDYLVKGAVDEASLLRSIRYSMTRKEAEQMARMAVTFEKSVLQEILQNAPISIARFDANLVVTACNDVFMRQFGTNAKPLIGQSIKSLLPSISTVLWEETISKGRPFKMERCRVLSEEDGDGPIWDLVVWSIKGRGGDTRGGIIIGIDVSQRVALESQKEDFIAALAHDIKNPLVGAGQVLQSLVDGSLGSIDEPQKDVLGMLKVSNDNVLLMLHNLLDVYRYESVSQPVGFGSVSIDQALNAAIAMVAPLAADRGIAVERQLPDNLKPALGDMSAIQRLLTNLLHNALKFSHDNSAIQISAHNAEPDYVVIKVVDHGIGMTDAQEKALFKRFGQSKVGTGKEGAGTGLGLYLCKQIAEAHNGSISCASTSGQGCTFEVKIPSASRISEPATK